MRRNSTRFVKLLVVAFATFLITVAIYKTLNNLVDTHDDLVPGKSTGNGPMRAFVDRLRGRAVDVHSLHPAKKDFFSSDRNVENKLIDWHDYEFMEKERQRSGLGEHGVAAKLSADLEEKRVEIFNQNGFNGLLSDMISLNRSVADIRHKE